jgi:hypothetical protein
MSVDLNFLRKVEDITYPHRISEDLCEVFLEAPSSEPELDLFSSMYAAPRKSSDSLLEVLKEPGYFIAGGVFKDFFLSCNIKDFDVFSDSEESMQKFLNQIDTEDPVYDTKNSAGYYAYGALFDVVHRDFRSLEETLENFDFTVAKLGVERVSADSSTLRVVFHKDYFTHLRNREIVFESSYSTYTLDELLRVLRYYKYGFSLTDNSFIENFLKENYPSLTVKDFPKGVVSELADVYKRSHFSKVDGSHSSSIIETLHIKNYLDWVIAGRPYISSSDVANGKLERRIRYVYDKDYDFYVIKKFVNILKSKNIDSDSFILETCPDYSVELSILNLEILKRNSSLSPEIISKNISELLKYRESHRQEVTLKTIYEMVLSEDWDFEIPPEISAPLFVRS